MASRSSGTAAVAGERRDDDRAACVRVEAVSAQASAIWSGSARLTGSPGEGALLEIRVALRLVLLANGQPGGAAAEGAEGGKGDAAEPRVAVHDVETKGQEGQRCTQDSASRTGKQKRGSRSSSRFSVIFPR